MKRMKEKIAQLFVDVKLTKFNRRKCQKHTPTKLEIFMRRLATIIELLFVYNTFCVRTKEEGKSIFV